jgi:16S rRNA (cytidine1402-2'-O)-methyltransferase
MKAGRLLLLPSLLGEDVEAELPPKVVAIARVTKHFLAERAKTTRAFLKIIGHAVPLQDLDIVEIGHAPDAARLDGWLEPLRKGDDVAIVSEAGCPAIADPGATIVARAHELAFEVCPLVGPSSLLLALMASGLDGQRFRFVGYLPREPDRCNAAIEALESASRAGETQLFIETPYRNEKLFDALLRLCSAGTRLTVAAALLSSRQSVNTRAISAWRALPEAKRPQLRNQPAIFALLAPARAPARKR